MPGLHSRRVCLRRSNPCRRRCRWRRIARHAPRFSSALQWPPVEALPVSDEMGVGSPVPLGHFGFVNSGLVDARLPSPGLGPERASDRVCRILPSDGRGSRCFRQDPPQGAFLVSAVLPPRARDRVCGVRRVLVGTGCCQLSLRRRAPLRHLGAREEGLPGRRCRRLHGHRAHRHFPSPRVRLARGSSGLRAGRPRGPRGTLGGAREHLHMPVGRRIGRRGCRHCPSREADRRPLPNAFRCWPRSRGLPCGRMRPGVAA